jgi:hypothetical protein
VSSSVSPSASDESSVERSVEICVVVLVRRLEYQDDMAKMWGVRRWRWRLRLMLFSRVALRQNPILS